MYCKDIYVLYSSVIKKQFVSASTNLQSKCTHVPRQALTCVGKLKRETPPMTQPTKRHSHKHRKCPSIKLKQYSSDLDTQINIHKTRPPHPHPQYIIRLYKKIKILKCVKDSTDFTDCTWGNIMSALSLSIV